MKFEAFLSVDIGVSFGQFGFNFPLQRQVPPKLPGQLASLRNDDALFHEWLALVKGTEFKDCFVTRTAPVARPSPHMTRRLLLNGANQYLFTKRIDNELVSR